MSSCVAVDIWADAELGPLGINYGYWFDCDMQGYSLIAWPILLAWLCVLFYLLGDTADAYFAPNLELICDKLKPALRSWPSGTERRTYLPPLQPSVRVMRRLGLTSVRISSSQ